MSKQGDEFAFLHKDLILSYVFHFFVPITYIESSRNKFDGCDIGTSLIHNVKVIEIFRRILCFLRTIRLLYNIQYKVVDASVV